MPSITAAGIRAMVVAPLILQCNHGRHANTKKMERERQLGRRGGKISEKSGVGGAWKPREEDVSRRR